MGKRKPRADKNKTPPPAFVNYTSPMDSLSKEKSSHPVVSGGVKPLSSLMDIMESSVKLPSSNNSLSHRHRNLSRAILLRLPRHYHGRQYTHQYSTNHAGTSTSHGKATPVSDEKLALNLACKSESEPRRHTDRREKASRRPERIRSISLAADVASPDVEKMECGLCQKLLKRKPIIVLESTISSNDLSIVAVLACGHVYHANCLEMKTCYEDRTDPPCPLCLTVSSGVDSSRGHEQV